MRRLLRRDVHSRKARTCRGGPPASVDRDHAAGALLHLGVAPDMVREIVGHSDIEVTMTIYAHTCLSEKRQALGKLGDALA